MHVGIEPGSSVWQMYVPLHYMAPCKDLNADKGFVNKWEFCLNGCRAEDLEKVLMNGGCL